MNQKYKHFMNYMHNEIGITKEDIKEWTKEATFEVAKNYIEHQFSKAELEKMIREQLRMLIEGRYSHDGIKSELAKELSERIVLSLRQAKD